MKTIRTAIVANVREQSMFVPAGQIHIQGRWTEVDTHASSRQIQRSTGSHCCHLGVCSGTQEDLMNNIIRIPTTERPGKRSNSRNANDSLERAISITLYMFSGLFSTAHREPWYNEDLLALRDSYSPFDQVSLNGTIALIGCE